MPVYTLEQPPKLNVFGHCYLISRLAKSLELAVNAEKVAKTFGASKRLCHTLKMQYADRKNALFLPSCLCVFGQCDLMSGLIEMLRTILELADYPIKISVVIDAPR